MQGGQPTGPLQRAPLSAGSLDTLMATNGVSDAHRSQQVRPPRSRQSLSNAQAEYSGTWRTSKASQREFTQRAAMLGFNVVGHPGQGIGTGHVSALKTSTCAALTPANEPTSGIPQGSQQPLRTATQTPGPVHAPQSIPLSFAPDPPVPEPPAPAPPEPPASKPPVPAPPPDPALPDPPTPEVPPVVEVPPVPEAPPRPEVPPAPEAPPDPDVPPVPAPAAPPRPAPEPPVVAPPAPPLPPELPPAPPPVPPVPPTPPVASVPASAFVPAAPDAAALPPSGSPGWKMLPPHPTARPRAAIAR
jgi:hypothetical protein